MTQQQWDLIGYGVWAIIIWMTVKQYMQTKRAISGNGLKLLLGDWLLFAPVPWIMSCMMDRATLEEVCWTLGLGVLVSVPYILTSKFEVKANGSIQFKSNWIFYIFLFGLPYVRYTIRDKVFHSSPILTAHHTLDIELMLAMYILVLVVYTFVWRLSMYIRYKQLVNRSILKHSVV